MRGVSHTRPWSSGRNRRTRKVEPCPGVLVADISPPISSVSILAIVSPSPAPGAALPPCALLGARRVWAEAGGRAALPSEEAAYARAS